MKATRTDITAGEASESAFSDVTTGLLTAWGASSLGLFTSGAFHYFWPEWTVFNPLVLIGIQGAAVINLWGIPFAIINLVVTWRLVFHSADRKLSALAMFVATAIIGLGVYNEYAIQRFWAYNGEYVVLMAITSTLLVVACWALWRIRRKRKDAEPCNGAYR